MNTHEFARELKCKIDWWMACEVEKRLPDVHRRVMDLLNEGRVSDAGDVLEQANVFYIEQQGRPYWRGIVINDEMVAERDFSPFGIPRNDTLDAMHYALAACHRNVSTEPAPTLDFDGLIELRNQLRALGPLRLPTSAPDLQNQELATNDHVDHYLKVERDERKRRQRKMGEMFVKYGITPV